MIPSNNSDRVPASTRCFTVPQSGLLNVEAAREQLLAAVNPVTETALVPLEQALGRVLASTQLAPIAVPSVPNSAMDGYALRAADTTGASPIRLPVQQRIAAGDVPAPLLPGTAARIFTGAALPLGADAVVMQETTRLEADTVLLEGPVAVGQFVRHPGEDIPQGHALLTQGTHLAPQHLGLAASVGLAALPVFRPLRVAVVTTGSELVAPGQPLPPGKIYDANRYVLLAMLAQLHCQTRSVGTVHDDRQAILEALEAAAHGADLVLTSGGVSVGEEDHVRAAVETLGELSLWRIAMKPGKPLAFGRIGTTPFLGLPGNPVSAFVTFCLFARPLIMHLQGGVAAEPHPVWVGADFEWKKPGPRREFLRARRMHDGQGGERAVIYPNQSSGVLSSVTWAEGVVCVPEGQTVARGDRVAFLPFTELGVCG